MNNSTLGGLIKDYRTQKGISQLDIAFALGWKEPSRLSRIEQGKTEKPTREVLDKIIAAIGLSEEEKNVLLFTGGYLPTEEEILKIKVKTHNKIHEWSYPSGVIDFSWRLIDGNKHMNELYDVPEGLSENLHKSNLRVLDILFKNEFPKNKNINQTYDENMLLFLKTTIINFKYEHKNRTREKWYIDHVKSLMENELFRELWSEASLKNEEHVIVGKFTTKHFINPKNKTKLLNFYLFMVPVLQDPRFEVELTVPMDIDTYNYYL